MIISDLYKVIITANKYETKIDNEDVILTVTVQDFNNQPVTGKTIDLKVDKGYFTKKGNSAISGTSTKTISAQSDSNGQITAQWKASEWGLATFTVGNNSSNIQVLVNGWRTIYSHTSTGSFMRTNGEIVDFYFKTVPHTENLTNSTHTYLGKFAHFTGDNTKYNPSGKIFFTDVKGIELKIKVAESTDASTYASNQLTAGEIFLTGTSFNTNGSSISNYSFEVNGTYAIR